LSHFIFFINGSGQSGISHFWNFFYKIKYFEYLHILNILIKSNIFMKSNI